MKLNGDSCHLPLVPVAVIRQATLDYYPPTEVHPVREQFLQFSESMVFSIRG